MELDSLRKSLDNVVNTITSELGEEEIKAKLQKGQLWSRIQQAAEALIPAIEAVPELEMLNNRWHAIANRWMGVNYQSFASSLIWRALDAGSTHALEELDQYVNDDSYQVYQISLIGGVQVQKPVQLANGIQLIPFDPSNEDDLRMILTDDAVEIEKISAALVKHHRYPRRHEQPGKDYPSPVMPGLLDFKELDAALLCLTVSGPYGPARIGTSYGAVGWIPIMSSRPLLGGEQIHRVQLVTLKELQACDISQLQQIHDHFTKLSKKRQDTLRIPMTLLNRALRREWDVYSAIDLGIIFELLFSDNKPMDSSISFTLRLRAARVLRSGRNDREKVAGIVKDLYSLRSKAAHMGELPQYVRGMDASQFLERIAAPLAAEAIQHFILRGEPDWNNVIYG